jgi:parallel beta-helix repeat protein
MKINLTKKETLIICIIIGSLLMPSGITKPVPPTSKLKTPVLTVDDDGDGDFIHIQDAIDNATAGTTIEVYSGEYRENITCDKQLILQGIPIELGNGSSTGKPIIVMYDPGCNINLITLHADDCTISTFHLKGEGSCLGGIEVESCNNSISFCDFEHINFGLCIYLDASNTSVFTNTFTAANVVMYSDNNKVFENYFSSSGYAISIAKPGHDNQLYQNTIVDSYACGIHLWCANLNNISKNTIRRCDIGIEIFDEGGSDDDSIWSNTISDCSKGIDTHGKRHLIFQNNVVDCTDGITCNGKTFKEYTSQVHKNTVRNCENGIVLHSTVNATNNDIHDCTTGLLLDDAFDCLIANNTMHKNTDGIVLKDSGYSIICNNTISQNTGTGITFLNGYNNLLYHNAFLSNHRSAFTDNDLVYPWTDYNHWNLGYSNTGGGNYWSDYRGKDRNHDGIGDTPYTIPDTYPNPLTNDHDHFPIMDPDTPLTCNPTLIKLYTLYDHLIRLLLRGYPEFYPGFP